LREALLQSCNVYFMQVGRRLGGERLQAAMAGAGFGRPTGWPLGEQAGHLPRRRLTEGEIALLAIGQGEILVTPLQSAVVAAAFANGGSLVRPWVVARIAGRPVRGRTARRRSRWLAETTGPVTAGLRAVVRNPAGTGHRAFSRSVGIAG